MNKTTFFKQNPNFDPDFTMIYRYENEGQKQNYVFVCNELDGGAVPAEFLERFKEKAAGAKDPLSTFADMVMKEGRGLDSSILDGLGDLLMNKRTLTAGDIVSYFSSFSSKNKTAKLSASNNVKAYRISAEGKVEKEAAFAMSFKIQQVRNYHGKTPRAFIEEVESFDKRKGLMTFAINEMLPEVLLRNDVRYIVLNASAFDNEMGMNQNKLETIYNKLGFQKAYEDEHYNFIRPSDFEQGLPVYFRDMSGRVKLNDLEDRTR